MIIVGVAALRRAMRRHQDIEPRPTHLPLWRLLLGEAWWAAQQLRQAPAVLLALLVGAGATFAVLDAAAPGPVFPWPGRIVLSLLAGLALARGTWTWMQRSDTADTAGDSAPAVAATEVVAALVALVLAGWLVVWLAAVLG